MSTSIYGTILNSFSPSFRPVNHCHTEYSQSESIAMAREVAQISDDEKRDSCSTCQDLAFRDESWTPFQTPRENRNIWEVKASHESLRLSSREGCPSCDLLYQFSKIVLKDIPDSRPELVTLKYNWWWADSMLDIKMEHGDTALERRFPMFVTRGQSACGKSYTYAWSQSRTYRDIAGTYLLTSRNSNFLQESILLGRSYTLHGTYPNTVLPPNVFQS